MSKLPFRMRESRHAMQTNLFLRSLVNDLYSVLIDIGGCVRLERILGHVQESLAPDAGFEPVSQSGRSCSSEHTCVVDQEECRSQHARPDGEHHANATGAPAVDSSPVRLEGHLVRVSVHR